MIDIVGIGDLAADAVGMFHGEATVDGFGDLAGDGVGFYLEVAITGQGNLAARGIPFGVNIFTDLEGSLKTLLTANVLLAGVPVPVQIVTPDPDFVELETPCITLQLVDFRRDGARREGGRIEEKDLDAMTAVVQRIPEPFNLYYEVVIHTEKSRDDRMIFEQLAVMLDDHPVITTEILAKKVYLHRDLAFREISKARDFAKSLTVIARIRLDSKEFETIPLVQELVTTVDET